MGTSSHGPSKDAQGYLKFTRERVGDGSRGEPRPASIIASSLLAAGYRERTRPRARALAAYLSLTQ
jgi:hypothetical protein